MAKRARLDRIPHPATQDYGQEICNIQSAVLDFFQGIKGLNALKFMVDTQFVTVKEIIKLRDHPRKNKKEIEEKVELLKAELIQLLHLKDSHDKDPAYGAMACFLYAALVLATRGKEFVKRPLGLRQARVDALEEIGMPIDLGMNR